MAAVPVVGMAATGSSNSSTRKPDAPARYLVALGDSLSQGMQPVPRASTSIPTANTPKILNALRKAAPKGAKLVAMKPV
jgi:hypothetical protein